MSDDLDFDMEVVENDKLTSASSGKDSPPEEPNSTQDYESNGGTAVDDMSNMSSEESLANGSSAPTELGDIPRGWDKAKLAHVAEDESDAFVDGPFGSSLKANEYHDQGHARVVQLQNIRPGRFVDTNHKYVTEEKFEEISRHGAQPGDVAFAKMAAPVARACMLPDIEPQYVVVADCIKLSVDESRYNSLFVMKASNSRDVWRQAFARSRGSTRKRINLTQLKQVEIPSPSLSEQRKIASVLYAVDQAIQKTEAIIEQAKRVNRGLVRDLMSHGLGGETQSVRLGPKEFSVPKSWKMVKLGELFDLVNGRVFDKNEWADEGVRIIRIQDLREDANSSVNYCNHEVDEKYHVNSGDLLFCWAGNIKTSLGAYIWKEEIGYLNQHIYNMNPKVDVDLRFFKYAINRYLRIIKTMAGGSAGQVHVTKTDFERFELPVPDLRTQRLIAQRLNSAEEHAERVKDELSQLARLKKGLMQDLLTGEVRTMDKAIEVLGEVKAYG